LYRLKGELSLLPAGLSAVPAAQRDAAQASFNEAMETARRRGARSLELRAASSLAALLGEEGRTHAARQILAPVYDAFTEGFGTADLREARQLLDTLASSMNR
jgi:predicted ATPase